MKGERSFVGQGEEGMKLIKEIQFSLDERWGMTHPYMGQN